MFELCAASSATSRRHRRSRHAACPSPPRRGSRGHRPRERPRADRTEFAATSCTTAMTSSLRPSSRAIASRSCATSRARHSSRSQQPGTDVLGAVPGGIQTSADRLPAAGRNDDQPTSRTGPGGQLDTPGYVEVSRPVSAGRAHHRPLSGYIRSIIERSSPTTAVAGRVAARATSSASRRARRSAAISSRVWRRWPRVRHGRARSPPSPPPSAGGRRRGSRLACRGASAPMQPRSGGPDAATAAVAGRSVGAACRQRRRARSAAARRRAVRRASWRTRSRSSGSPAASRSARLRASSSTSVLRVLLRGHPLVLHRQPSATA